MSESPANSGAMAAPAGKAPSSGQAPAGQAPAGQAEVVEVDRRKLLERHLSGDEQAFGELISEYRRQVYSYIVRCGVLPSVRDDLFQEIFLKVHRSAHTYQAERALEPWLFTIVANTVRSHYRKQAVRRRVYSDKPPEEDSPPAEPTDTTLHSGEDAAEARETAQWLESELQGLPLKQREAIVLCCFKNLNQKDASQALGIPVNTLKTHLRRGRAQLAKSLARRNAAVQREVRV